jgi:hypothetical protein
VVSQYSSKSKQSIKSLVPIDPDAQIRTGILGKVIGMTDAEWNAQV